LSLVVQDQGDRNITLTQNQAKMQLNWNLAQKPGDTVSDPWTKADGILCLLGAGPEWIWTLGHHRLQDSGHQRQQHHLPLHPPQQLCRPPGALRGAGRPAGAELHHLHRAEPLPAVPPPGSPHPPSVQGHPEHQHLTAPAALHLPLPGPPPFPHCD
ncbi:histone-lysine N-methyltransferase 2E-like, partial [Otolemur garnettii]|uniref:histone-lysine N-methyltransferase 2E-like n=1 Tax=Otolemur garnettii TaxID=30611 RepID=UPI0006442994